jgi:hypothetical protein
MVGPAASVLYPIYSIAQLVCLKVIDRNRQIPFIECSRLSFRRFLNGSLITMMNRNKKMTDNEAQKSVTQHECPNYVLAMSGWKVVAKLRSAQSESETSST